MAPSYSKIICGITDPHNLGAGTPSIVIDENISGG